MCTVRVVLNTDLLHWEKLYEFLSVILPVFTVEMFDIFYLFSILNGNVLFIGRNY